MPRHSRLSYLSSSRSGCHTLPGVTTSTEWPASPYRRVVEAAQGCSMLLEDWRSCCTGCGASALLLTCVSCLGPYWAAPIYGYSSDWSACLSSCRSCMPLASIGRGTAMRFGCIAQRFLPGALTWRIVGACWTAWISGLWTAQMRWGKMRLIMVSLWVCLTVKSEFAVYPIILRGLGSEFYKKLCHLFSLNRVVVGSSPTAWNSMDFF